MKPAHSPSPGSGRRASGRAERLPDRRGERIEARARAVERRANPRPAPADPPRYFKDPLPPPRPFVLANFGSAASGFHKPDLALPSNPRRTTSSACSKVGQVVRKLRVQERCDRMAVMQAATIELTGDRVEPADVVAVARHGAAARLSDGGAEAMRERRDGRAARRRRRAGVRRVHGVRLARRHLDPGGAARGAPAGAAPLACLGRRSARRARGRAGDDAAAGADSGDGLLRGPAAGGRDDPRAAERRASRRWCRSTARSERAATSRRSPTADSP